MRLTAILRRRKLGATNPTPTAPKLVGKVSRPSNPYIWRGRGSGMEENQNPTSPIAGEPALIDAPALVSIRAMLNLALNEYEEVMRGKPRYGPALDLSATVDTAVQYIDDLLGITTSDYPEADDDEDPYAGDAEGEMRAEAEAERRADAAYEIACELWTLDPYDGWY